MQEWIRVQPTISFHDIVVDMVVWAQENVEATVT